MRSFILIALLSTATAAIAQDTCGPLPDHASEKNEIYDQLRIARDATDARILSDDLWRLWLDAPDMRAQELLDEGMARNRVGDTAGSIAALDALIAYCPDYAEAYNQRAYTAFLAQDYETALRNLDLALDREPRHLGALTGKALTLIGMGREDDAQEPLRLALRLNRWLSERALLTGPMEEEI